MKQTQFKLRAIILFLVVLLLLLGSYTQKKYDENLSLKSSLQLLETSFEQQLQKNQQQFDSLQQHIRHQNQLQLKLKDSLAGLETLRIHLNHRSNENKAAIARIHDVDSLYNVVARHYLQQ